MTPEEKKVKVEFIQSSETTPRIRLLIGWMNHIDICSKEQLWESLKLISTKKAMSFLKSEKEIIKP